MTMHEEWTDKLSDYLDDELTAGETTAVEAHLRECAACTDVLNDLKRVIARARALERDAARPPQTDLWPGIEQRIERIAQPRRVTFTLPQLAAAAVLLMALSGTVAWQVAQRTTQVEREAVAERSADATTAERERTDAERNTAVIVPINLADAQYDAAVADLEKALKQSRGRLDRTTIQIVEHNLEIIDQAIAQARDALVGDPANAYLSGHLVEARRRKLDLLRRAAALADAN